MTPPPIHLAEGVPAVLRTFGAAGWRITEPDQDILRVTCPCEGHVLFIDCSVRDSGYAGEIEHALLSQVCSGSEGTS